MKKAVLLINLGTPDQCDKRSIYRYLKEFLNDPRVIDLPAIVRWPFVNGFILPFRYKKTLAAYQKIWKGSSPLLHNSEKFTHALASTLGHDYEVVMGMRYGNPNIQAAFDQIKHLDSILVIPLFPQFSSAATGSAIEKLCSVIGKQWNMPQLMIENDFYQDNGFITAYAELIKKHIKDKDLDLLLFSFHGLPERHIKKSFCHAPCDRKNTCPSINEFNRFCYRSQCYVTSQLIAEKLNLQPHQYQVAFQSRLGRTPWIKPYTDLLLAQLVKKGVKNIAVVCPSFVADCLETLEEINIRARKQWSTLGGKEFTFIPCLNDSNLWVKAVAEMVQKKFRDCSVNN